MHRLLRPLIAAFLVLAGFAHAAPFELRIVQRDSTDTISYTRQIAPPNPFSQSSILLFDSTSGLPVLVPFSGLTWDGSTLSASTGSQADWNATSGLSSILNKPTLATVATSGQYGDLVGTPSLSGYATTTALNAGLATKLATPSGTTSQYVRGDGTLGTSPTLATVATTGAYADLTGKPTIPTVTAFNFSQPATRTLAVSTSYQASDPTKAAVLYPSFSCQNATTVLAASGCTLQVRMGTGTLTCSTGTVYYTQSLTVALGVLITQSSTNPVPIFLPIGASFILCPTTGTFTTTSVEQTAG